MYNKHVIIKEKPKTLIIQQIYSKYKYRQFTFSLCDS